VSAGDTVTEAPEAPEAPEVPEVPGRPAVRLCIAPGDAPNDPTHGHTLGLCEAFAHPELLLVGLPAELVAEFLGHAVGLVAGGRRFEHGQAAEGLFPGAPAALRRVGEQHYDAYLAEGVAHYGTTEFATLQIVFPDRAGRYPWETGADLMMRLCQPVLDGKHRKCRWSCG
jgi:hypothetical protein